MLRGTSVRPLLTIAIPTFDRLRWLSLTLTEVIKQTAEVTAGTLEVVVSDNCSADGTWPYLQGIASQFPFVRLNRNATNIGAEANFHLLPKLATGSYLHILGDDDLLEPGTLARIVEALQDRPDYLIINFDIYDNSFQVCLQTNRLNVTEDDVFLDHNACLRRIDPMAMSFISMWVGRREFFNAIPDEKYRYLANFGMSVQGDRYFGIVQFPKGKLIAAPCLRTRKDTEFNNDVYFSWFLHGGAEVFRLLVEEGVLPKATVRAQKGQLLRKHGLSRIRYERRKGIFRRAETYKLLRDDYGDLPDFWLLCVPAMFIPGLGKVIELTHWLLGRSDS